jgi:hypothetical protein
MMKRVTASLLSVVMLMSVSAMAMDGPEVQYVNGTAPGVKEGSVGMVDTSVATALEFHAGATGFSIPYEGISVYKYREENRFRLGVLATIAVGIVKARSKRHLLTITWKDSNGVAEVVTLEASKDEAIGLVALLRARAAQADCGTRMWPSCVPEK